MKKRILTIVMLLVGLAGLMPVYAENGDFEQVFGKIEQVFGKNKLAFVQKLKTHFDQKKRSVPQDLAEVALLAVMHGGMQVDKDGNFFFDAKKGIIAARDGIEKKAAYGLVNEAISKAAYSLTNMDEDNFDKLYKNWAKDWVGDGVDFAWRGIKYWNKGEEDKKSFQYFVKDEFVPYYIRRLVVRYSQKLVGYGITKVLESHSKGQMVLAGHRMLCMVPIIGMEVEQMEKNAFEFVYDKSLAFAKKIFEKYIKPRLGKSTELQTDSSVVQ